MLSTALDLQLVQEVEAELKQVLQVKWHPMMMQLPEFGSRLYPVLHLQLKSVCRAALDLQVLQLLLVAPVQVLHEFWQSWQFPKLSL